MVDVQWEDSQGGGGQGSAGPFGLSGRRTADRPRAHAGTTDTEIAIFEATERLLANRPLSDLSVAQIIEAAGISRATFYFYFSSKYAVLGGLLNRLGDEIFQVVQPFVQRHEDVAPEQAMHESLTAAVELWRRHRPALRAIHEHWNATEQLRMLWISVIGRFAESTATELERQRQDGLARHAGDSLQIASALIWSTVQCLYVAGLGVDPNLPDERTVLPVLLRMWHSVLYVA